MPDRRKRKNRPRSRARRVAWHYLKQGPFTPWQVGPVRFSIEARDRRYRMHMETISPLFREAGWRPPLGSEVRWGPIPQSIQHLSGDALMRALVEGNATRLCDATGLQPTQELQDYLSEDQP